MLEKHPVIGKTLLHRVHRRTDSSLASLVLTKRQNGLDDKLFKTDAESQHALLVKVVICGVFSAYTMLFISV